MTDEEKRQVLHEDAVRRARLGGLARAARMTPEQRSASARKARAAGLAKMRAMQSNQNNNNQQQNRA